MIYKRRIDLMRYLFMIANEVPFRIWRFTFHIAETKLFLYYKQSGNILYSIEIRYNFKTMDEYGKVKKTISEFVIDCYYWHERDGKPVDYNTLKALLWISNKKTVIKTLFSIRKKINDIAERLEKDGISLLDK